MSVTADIRQQARQRANYACEYCGISETGTGGLLTLDHYIPKSKGGEDTLENLVYACFRCNQYKSDYWSQNPEQPQLWNPRLEPAESHFLELADGALYPFTPSGISTIRILRLNRAELRDYRNLKKQRESEKRFFLHQNEVMSQVMEFMRQQKRLIQEQHDLIKTQNRLLKIRRRRKL